MKLLYAASVTALVTVPTLAASQSFERESYTLPVTQIDADSFEVTEADGAGGSQMWCAAGLYARKALGLWKADLSIEVPRGPSPTMPGRQGVVFTVAPAVDTTSSLFAGTRQAGQTFSVGHANAICSQYYAFRIRTGPNTLIRK